MFPKLLLLSTLILLAVTAEAKVRSISLSYLSGEEVVQLIRPMLGSDDSVSVIRGIVYLDSGRSVFNKINTLLGQADVAPALYLLSVRETRGHMSVRSGKISEGSRKTRVEAGGHQQIHASTGRPVFIETGVGVSALGVDQSARRRGNSVQTELGVKGFHVLLNVGGDIVTLSASDIQTSDRYNRPDEVDPSNFIYSVEGLFGQWIPLMKAINTDKKLGITNRQTVMSPVSRYQIRVSKITR